MEKSYGMVESKVLSHMGNSHEYSEILYHMYRLSISHYLSDIIGEKGVHGLFKSWQNNARTYDKISAEGVDFV